MKVTEECLQLGIDDFAVAPRDLRLHLADGVLCASFRAESVRTLPKIRFEDGFDHEFHGRLDNPVAHRGNP